MMVRFVCTYEGWQKEYDATFVPNIGHDVDFPDKEGIYSVINVVHNVISLTQRNARTVPSVKVYVRPRDAGIGRKSLRLAGGQNPDSDLYVIDPEAEKRRVAELVTEDYRE